MKKEAISNAYQIPRRVTVIGMCLQVLMKFHQLLFKILRKLSIQKPLRITIIILAPSP